MNISPKVKQWINVIVLKFWSDWDSLFVARGQKNWNLMWAVHYDSAPMITAYSVHVSCQIGIPVFQQLSCSHNMAPYNFWLFSQLKMALNGKRFYDIDTIKENMMKHLRSVLKYSIKKYSQQWQYCWQKCIASQGEHFEVD